LTLSELVACTGLPKTTVHRMALELVALGALERRNGGYALGPRLFELGQLVPRHRALRDVALPYMHDLYEVTRETVQLAVPCLGARVKRAAHAISRALETSPISLESRAA
jgi:DNA-binding IclR family transcriptional regulator